MSQLQVKLWGVRGSIPAPVSNVEYQRKLLGVLGEARAAWKAHPDLTEKQIVERLPMLLSRVIGGETTCVEVMQDDFQLVLDMGTGARRLGYDMMARGRKGDIHILLTHTHWDHIQGWPFFVPGYIPTNTMHFYSAHMNCEERFVRQQHPDHFPLGFYESRSQKQFHLFKTGERLDIGPFKILTAPLMHPGDSVAYRIEAGGKVFIFATDAEFFGDDLKKALQSRKKFFHKADLLIMDSQYSTAEAEQKIGWGHTAMPTAVDCAVEWKVKHIVLTHHEPAHEDETIYKMFDEAREHAEKAGANGTKISLASEGMSYDL